MRVGAVLAFISTFLFAHPVGAQAEPSARQSLNGAAVIREMNLAREHPDTYAGYIAAMRQNFRGNILVLPGGTLMRTHEGISAIDEAVRFLHSTRTLPPLAVSPGISMAAAEHVADQKSGGFGHGGSDGSNPAERLSRHGARSGAWGENISYGKSTARDIVIALIVDDGQRGRKHRKNIFNPAFNFVGAAVGPHARYGIVCDIDFAGDAECRPTTYGPLFAGKL